VWGSCSAGVVDPSAMGMGFLGGWAASWEGATLVCKGADVVKMWGYNLR